MVNPIYIFWCERFGWEHFSWLIGPFLFDKKEYKRQYIQDLNEAFKSFEISAVVEYRSNNEPSRCNVPFCFYFPSLRYEKDMEKFRNTSPQDEWVKFPDAPEENFDVWRVSNEYIKQFQQNYFRYLSGREEPLFYKEDLTEDHVTFYTHIPPKPRSLAKFDDLWFNHFSSKRPCECVCGEKVSSDEWKMLEHWWGKSKKHLMWKHEHGYRRMLKQAKREEWKNIPTIEQYDKGLRTDFIELEF